MLGGPTLAGSNRTSSRTRRPSQKARDNGNVGAIYVAAILETMQKRQTQQFIEANTQLRNENNELKDMITNLPIATLTKHRHIQNSFLIYIHKMESLVYGLDI